MIGLLISILFPVFLFCQEIVVIDSDEASYDGNNVELRGHVVVDHDIGAMSAGYMRFSRGQKGKLFMKDHVLISLKDNGQLSCAQAEIDGEFGIFSGDAQQKDVVYTDMSQRRIPLVVKSSLMHVQLSPENKAFIKISTSGHVTVHYDNDFIITADEGIYDRRGDINLKGHCQVTNRDNDLIHADSIHINTNNCHMILQNDVVIKHHALGTFTTDKGFQLTYAIIDGKKKLKTLQSIGKTEKQVAYSNELGKIFADHVNIKYPDQFILEGNVRILNRHPFYREDGSILQYALADRVEYAPETQEMIFTAKEDGRVLFFDKLNDVQISAPAIKMRRDITTNKNTIQGIGEVRFSFLEQEAEQIKKQFRFTRDKP